MENVQENRDQKPMRLPPPGQFFISNESYRTFGRGLLSSLEGLAADTLKNQGPELGQPPVPTQYTKKLLMSSTVANMPAATAAPVPRASTSRSPMTYSPEADLGTLFDLFAQSAPNASLDGLPAPSNVQMVASTANERQVNSELDHLDIEVPIPPLVTCRWRGCVGMNVEPHRLFNDHFLDHSDRGHGKEIAQAADQVRCLWEGCVQQKPMNGTSLKRHVECTHLGMKRRKCSRCGVTKRVDAYKKEHGPARYCMARPRAKTRTAPLFAPPTPTDEMPPIAGPSTQLLPAAPSMSLPVIPPVPSLASSTDPGPMRRTRTRHAHSASVQGSIAYPPPNARAMVAPEAPQTTDSVEALDFGLPSDREGWLALLSQTASGSSTPPAALPLEEEAAHIPAHDSQEQFLQPPDASLQAFVAAIQEEFGLPGDFGWPFGVNENCPPQAQP
ncbi:hypothetical protein PYCCODRAFT_1470685 [Trametes coccinea BRFM310]|uniref:Uncharacterized protein n=1 Tax=Trametes coccinea (strain BRFM310) TaxID=1353009 RepID=A0A1Y2IDW5_TRAC3|nr:hypothetical protein PYCCODRAFT_1470685 [Trametes coccinea BRFM310]